MQCLTQKKQPTLTYGPNPIPISSTCAATTQNWDEEANIPLSWESLPDCSRPTHTLQNALHTLLTQLHQCWKVALNWALYLCVKQGYALACFCIRRCSHYLSEKVSVKRLKRMCFLVSQHVSHIPDLSEIEIAFPGSQQYLSWMSKNMGLWHFWKKAFVLTLPLISWDETLQDLMSYIWDCSGTKISVDGLCMCAWVCLGEAYTSRWEKYTKPPKG